MEPVTQAAALTTLSNTVALWHAGEKTAADVVFAACDVLVSGVDGTALAELAAVQISRADAEVHALLPAALDEVGLPDPPEGSETAERAILTAMAARVLSGAVEPRYLTSWAHQRYGHDRLELAEHLAHLDDKYDVCDPGGALGERAVPVDAEVRAEARQIVAQNENTPGPTGPGMPRSDT